MFFNSSMEKYEILNRNHLKYLAIIFMMIDHVSFFYDPSNPIIIACGFISRTTAPIMALFIAEGYHYTRDVKKYMKRLFIFAIISYLPFALFLTGSVIPVQLLPGIVTPEFFLASGELNPQPFVHLLNSTIVILQTSVIFTLFLGLFTIYLWDKIILPIYIKVIITLLSDKNGKLLPQTLPRTQRVPFNTLGSHRPLSSVKLFIITFFEIFRFTSIVRTIIILNHVPSPNRNTSHFH